MKTPQEINEVTFQKAIFGGYDMGAVDDFIEETFTDYETLYNENADMKNKFKILVSKVEEYREKEQGLREALAKAQRTGANAFDQAQAESDGILRAAREEADKIIAAAKADSERIRSEATVSADSIRKAAASAAESTRKIAYEESEALRKNAQDEADRVTARAQETAAQKLEAMRASIAVEEQKLESAKAAAADYFVKLRAITARQNDALDELERLVPDMPARKPVPMAEEPDAEEFPAIVTANSEPIAAPVPSIDNISAESVVTVEAVETDSADAQELNSEFAALLKEQDEAAFDLDQFRKFFEDTADSEG